MSQDLKLVFSNLLGKYSENYCMINRYWDELYGMYTQPHRFYHNLRHLNVMMNELAFVKAKIDDFDSVLFAMFYHDVIYDVKQNDNESQSAIFATERLLSFGVNHDVIKKVENLILATKSHGLTLDVDTAYFLDADLAVLGQRWDEYLTYAQSIRKEYSIYSESLYTVGRKKVLQQLLDKTTIYQTTDFQNQYERQARVNLTRELDEL